ncbi:DNA/RNA non-specific endonuclease [Streptomyces sp. NPDC032472]|uniref:DNA/RNA non-specific endonuclease n=1 Tax=Streptomyces sp. NPDC032472 TaxID=3155018 RepID=UPI003401AD14
MAATKHTSSPAPPGTTATPSGDGQDTLMTLQRPVEEAAPGPGYDTNFLSAPITAPELDPSIKPDAVELNGSEVIPYTHFSLALSAPRRFAIWVGWNIDGASIKRLDRRGIEFRKDPRLPATAQVSNELYKGPTNRLDRGHIARRADLLWGPLSDAQKANRDSFFYTNITPQMDDFNQSARNGLWGRLEDAVFEDVEVDDLRVSVFGGPVFLPDDRPFRGVQIPREFWKVLVYAEGGTLKCKAFLLTQSLDLTESLDLNEFRVFQVKVSEIQDRAHIAFASAMATADTLALPRALEDRAPLARQADIDWS